MPDFQALSTHIRDLKIEIAKIQANHKQPTSITDTPKRPTIKRNRKAEARIADAVLETFDENELREMSHEMGVNYDAILGAGLRGKVTGVIEHFARHGIFVELVDYLTTERPHVNWHMMIMDTDELK